MWSLVTSQGDFEQIGNTNEETVDFGNECTQTGFLRFSLVNEHNTQPAYFDDFEIVHKPNADKLSVTSWAEYYAFGKVAKASCPSSGAYRYGYQGEFAEKDGETEWNSFELRQYDSEIGRWLSVDPYGQYWSPYVGMGNDPTNQIDPDGGFSGGGGNGDKNPPKEYLGDNSILPEIVVTPTGNFVGSVANFVANNPILHKQMTDFASSYVPQKIEMPKPATGEIKPDYTIESLIIPMPPITKFLNKGTGFVGQRLLNGFGGRIADVRRWKFTETGAQSEKAILDIMGKLKNGDWTVWSRPIHVIKIHNDTYLLNGHHRITAAIRMNYQGEIPFEKLSISEVSQLYGYQTVEEIIEASKQSW